MPTPDSSGATSAAACRPYTQGLFWTTIGYSAMVLGSIGAFLLIRSYGETLVALPTAPAESLAEATAKPADVLLHVLVALAAVIITGQLLAKLFAI